MTSNLDGERADILAGLGLGPALPALRRPGPDRRAGPAADHRERAVPGRLIKQSQRPSRAGRPHRRGPVGAGQLRRDVRRRPWPGGPTRSGCCRTRPWPASWPTTRRSPSGPTSWSRACPTWTPPPAAERPLVPARRNAVGPPGSSCTSSPRRAARRPRRHHPRVPRRRQVHGLTAGERRAGQGGGPSGRGCRRPPWRGSLDGLGERIHAADLGAQVALVDRRASSVS